MGCCIFGFPQAHTVVSRSFCEYLSLVSSPLICERTVLSSLSLRCFFMASFLSSISLSLRAFSWFSIFSSQRRALARKSLQTTHRPEVKPCRPKRTCKANQALTVPANTLCAAEKRTLQERRATRMHLKKKEKEYMHFWKIRSAHVQDPTADFTHSDQTQGLQNGTSISMSAVQTVAIFSDKKQLPHWTI